MCTCAYGVLNGFIDVEVNGFIDVTGTQLRRAHCFALFVSA